MRPAILLLFLTSTLALGTEFPEPYNSEPDKSAHPPTAAEAVGMIDLPDGFNATVYAAEPAVRNPIAMAWDHHGRMWVAENFTYAERQKRFDEALRDRILILHDKDGDGRADEHKVFADGLMRLTSVEIGKGGIWAMCPPQLLFIPDANGDDVPDSEPVVKLDGFTVAKSNYHNFANGLRWGPDGWLYGRCGHSCPGKIGTPGTAKADRIPMEGGIFRYHPEREVFEVVCHGTTNPWGHDWDKHGELFFINTVNGHLWHGISGAQFLESFGSSPNPGVYERLDMHADHWHFDTGQHWTKSRAGAANDFGGGHAHIGMMIYQADQWPPAMRDKLYTMNMHGLRTNVERLERHGSGYVGKHEPDIFLTKDQWFRGIDIRQGPDGSGYVLDWSDTGECHDSTGVHRTSGRIYRISSGNVTDPDLSDLKTITPEGIKRSITHPNVWYERQLRRRLTEAHSETLRAIYLGEKETVVRLRALWALHGIGAADEKLLLSCLREQDEHLRVWGIRLLCDRHGIDTIMGPRSPLPVDAEIHRELVRLAQEDPSGLVRLTLASTLQRLPLAQRIPIAHRLVQHSGDAADHNLSHIVWYGLIPAIEADPTALIEIAKQTSWPLLHRWIARALASDTTQLSQLLSTLTTAENLDPENVLGGMGDAFKGLKRVQEPPQWRKFASHFGGEKLSNKIRRFDLLFGNKKALEAIKALVLDPAGDMRSRESALDALIDNAPEDLKSICLELLAQPGINTTAVRGLAKFEGVEIGQQIADRYGEFRQADRGAIVEVLVSRQEWASILLKEIAAGKIPRSDLAAFHARQIRAFGDDRLSIQLSDVWGEMRESPEEKLKLIADWKAKLTPEHLAGADLKRGRTVFANICGACHKLYGEGGVIGPDLTGSGRKDLGYLLENIADPGAVVSNDYRMSIITLKDGRIVTGVIASENKKTLTLRQIAGELVVTKDQIKKRERPSVSMMPEGLLQVLDAEQVRDLIAYLMRTGAL